MNFSGFTTAFCTFYCYYTYYSYQDSNFFCTFYYIISTTTSRQYSTSDITKAAVYSHVCENVDRKEPLLLIRKSSPCSCGISRFLLFYAECVAWVVKTFPSSLQLHVFNYMYHSVQDSHFLYIIFCSLFYSVHYSLSYFIH